MRWLLAVVGVALAALSLWYLVAPPRGEAAYRDRAADSAETLRAQVQTARLWAAAVADGDTTGPAAAVGIEDGERRARAAAAKFEGYDPPQGADGVRERFSALAADATEQLSRMRIAARRGDWAAVARAEPRLERLADELERLRNDVRP